MSHYKTDKSADEDTQLWMLMMNEADQFSPVFELISELQEKVKDMKRLDLESEVVAIEDALNDQINEFSGRVSAAVLKQIFGLKISE